MHEDGSMNVPGLPYDGLPALEARKRVVADLKAQGFLIKEEPYTHDVGHCDRCHAVIEPLVSEQWWLRMETLRDKALEASAAAKVRWHPERYERTYLDWLHGLRDWNIGRQLWLGHRVPVYYCENGHQLVAIERPEACTECGSRELTQDPDVLDTWFSSALWPFATLGWPEETDDLRRHYPNDILISGFDIIFFWDARMAMQGIEFMGEAPWRTLYLHGLVRDARGQKMSKSKGNTVDPLGLIDRYDADALRFTLAAMESQGRDIKLDEKRVEGYRNFATKLWNAARFLQMNGVGASDSIAAPTARLAVNRWIIGEVVGTLANLERAFDDLRYDDMADAIYHFVWGTFCDWYVELVKGLFDEETKRVAAWTFDQILVMLHPLMPFITEELWHAMGERPYDLIVAKWCAPEAQVDPDAKRELDWLVRLVSEIRSARTELNVPPSAKLILFAADASDETAGRLDSNHATISRLARLDSIQLSTFPGTGAAQVVVDE